MSEDGTLNLVEASNLSKRYRDKDALQRAHLAVPAGELLSIVGPNGAGKTTLLSIIAGVQRQSAGDLTVAGPRVGWAPQQAAFCSKLTVVENLQLFARLQRLSDVDAAVRRMLHQVSLDHHARDRVDKLSGGNRQRLNIGLSLLGDPAVVALDEPTLALDPQQRRKLWDFVHLLADAGKAIVFSTHLVQEAFHHAHKILVLQNGEQIFYGTPVQLLQAAERLAVPNQTPATVPNQPPAAQTMPQQDDDLFSLEGRLAAGPERRRAIEDEGGQGERLEEAFVAFLAAHSRSSSHDSSL